MNKKYHVLTNQFHAKEIKVTFTCSCEQCHKKEVYFHCKDYPNQIIQINVDKTDGTSWMDADTKHKLNTHDETRQTARKD